ncbi:uncharacterized protein L969DRAFT_62292 [Mixia osmundae IAM 14324]|uniref:Uncharacterized protein n=1 Tax=Mixia osmundae (strain CBS 9802 / IAM 14324 / JCM 22182 / KY 12970) TaxID=764103 RepID=G7DVK8_MIXOS|nr:uncharacterized protein L969DRAFT_62292 [Mixia osmundae IAM 14324]KEI39539.1 hypothetical protein L969DRAFT_62292 [Mixia osmundae IAM 14324]GAA94618.1 hypothetical protein E5Q_01270 [Mixia osmundae IAM 14324]
MQSDVPPHLRELFLDDNERPLLPAHLSSTAVSPSPRPASSGDLVPAYKIFESSALPLLLPDLDQLICEQSTPEFSSTQPLLGSKEKKAWREWHKRSSRLSIWQRIVAAFVRTPVKPQGEVTLFPPFHLLPPNVSVELLTQNRRKGAGVTDLNTMLSAVIDGLISYEASATGQKLLRVELLRDTVQLLAVVLGLSPTSAEALIATTSVFKQYIRRITAVLSLSLASVFGSVYLWFSTFILLVMMCLYSFWKMTGRWRGATTSLDTRLDGEGFDLDGHSTQKLGWFTRLRKTKAIHMTLIFVLTSLYIPLSELTLAALVWRSDFWVVDDPYLTTDNPQPITLPGQKDGLDFCYTTTMTLGGFNGALPILLISAVCVLVYSLWFPLRLWTVVRASTPEVENYNEMGAHRVNLDEAYQRASGPTDSGRLNWLYQGYRKRWAAYKSLVMLFKLLVVAASVIITKDNCLLRHHPRAAIAAIQQATLSVLFLVWLVVQLTSGCYSSVVGNTVETLSRVGYLLIAVITLCSTLNIAGAAAVQHYGNTFISVLLYILSLYAIIAPSNMVQGYLQRFNRRLAFSLDVFSPYLHVEVHIKRRVWQETWTTILLGDEEFALDPKQRIVFVEPAGIAPTLLDFRDTVGERHIENLRLLTHLGSSAYAQACVMLHGAPTVELQDYICSQLSGPDAYWRPLHARAQVTSYFGRCVVIQFPFTLLFYYDDTGIAVSIRTLAEIHAFVAQNTSHEFREAQDVRRVLRALEGQIVYAPHVAYPRHRWWISAFLSSHACQYSYATLVIKRNSGSTWSGVNHSSGFRLSLEYRHDSGKRAPIRGDLAQLGLSQDFRLSPAFTDFVLDNRALIDEHLPRIMCEVRRLRQHFTDQMQAKRAIMSFQFLPRVFENIGNLHDISARLEKDENYVGLRSIMQGRRAAFELLQERLDRLSSPLARRWYIFFDDLYRRNHTVVSQIGKAPEAFSPFHKSSICYRPMTRLRLESFLRYHGLLLSRGDLGFFHTGFLNRLYFFLDEVVLRADKRIGINRDTATVRFDEIGATTTTAESGAQNLKYTGDAVLYDSPLIEAHQAFLFETVWDRPRVTWQTGQRQAWMRQRMMRFRSAIAVKLGLMPVPHARPGLGLYLRLRQTGSGWERPSS